MKVDEKTAIILTCHNRKDSTIHCLQSINAIAGSNENKFDTFLVDDGSTDGTQEAVKERFPKIHVIQGSGSLYWNQGMRLAWESAINHYDYDYYLWLNDDVTLFDYAIPDLFEGAEKFPNSIICGTMCSQNTEEKNITYGACDEYNKLIIPNDNFQVVKGPINGNLVLVPKSVYNKIGILDKVFSHGMGDNDYAYKAHKSGVNIYLVPRFSGVCESHDFLPKWCLKEGTIFSRLRFLYSPLGCNPYEFFILENRSKGFLRAIKSIFSLHLRAVFPMLWEGQ